MRIAIPLADDRLSPHFGHCEAFALVAQAMVRAPDHQPGLLPRWLAEHDASVIIAGGMGMRAQQLFAQENITVVVGAPRETPEAIVRAYLAGTLATGDNLCDH